MKKFVPFVSLSIIFGVLIAWGEGVLPLLDFKSFNMVDFAFISLLFSLLVVLLLVVFSGNFINALFSIIFYTGAYLGTKFYFGYQISLEVYVYSAILLVSGLLSGILLYTGRHILKVYSTRGKLRIKKDIAIPIIFFLVSILFSAFVVLAEQRAMYPMLLKYFYSYLYLLVGLSIIIAVLSFNEVSGFLIGFFALPIYFLMNRAIANDFNLSFLVYNEKNFLILVSIYSLLLAISTLIMGYSGRVFINGIKISRMVRYTVRDQKNLLPVKKVDKKAIKTSKAGKNIVSQGNSTDVKKNSDGAPGVDTGNGANSKKNESEETMQLNKNVSKDGDNKNNIID